MKPIGDFKFAQTLKRGNEVIAGGIRLRVTHVIQTQGGGVGMALAGCVSPLGQVCNPRGECADVIADTNFPKYDDYVPYVPSSVTVLTIETSQGTVRVAY